MKRIWILLCALALLLAGCAAPEAEDLLAELRSAGAAAAMVGEILERQEPEILVTTY